MKKHTHVAEYRKKDPLLLDTQEAGNLISSRDLGLVFNA